MTNPNDPRWNLNKKSLALCAIPDDDSQGIVVYYVGGHLEREVEEFGRFLEDLDLYTDDFQTGLWVWEGVYRSQKTPEGEDERVAYGFFREPTEIEWSMIKINECPWDETEWLLH